MAVWEINTGELFTLSVHSGVVAKRAWDCDTVDEVIELCNKLGSPTSSNRFPDFGDIDFRDVLPVDITVGPANINLGPSYEASADSIETLPIYSKYRVTAQYQLQHDVDVDRNREEQWPTEFVKPTHPTDTSLTMRVRNSGQFLLMPASSGIAAYYTEGGTRVGFANATISLAQLIPLREFHITCDRLQYYDCPNSVRLRDMCGKVNSDRFLGCDPDTLLCESADLDQSFVPDIIEPRRFKITLVLKERRVPKANKPGEFGGWNYEYFQGAEPNVVGGFYRLKLSSHNDRYLKTQMVDIFGP
jgi:hypothetical protein